MRKSQQVYAHNGYTFLRDSESRGKPHTIVSPKGKNLTRFQTMRIQFVATNHDGLIPAERLSTEETEARRGRAANVRTRRNLYMDPTPSTVKRIRQLEGKIKMGHNERVSKEARTR